MKTDRRENISSNVKITRIDLHHKLQLLTYPNMFSFGLSSVISKIFVADFEHVFVCW